MSKLLATVGIGFAFSAFAWANSVTDTTWDLEGVTFSDGSTATGSFTIDSSYDIVSYDITVSGDPFVAGEYTSGGGSDASISAGDTFLAFTSNDLFNLPALDLVLDTKLPSGSGSPIALSSSSDACGFGCVGLTGGSIVDAPRAAPEPASVALAVPAILGFALLYRRRKIAVN